jgi:hypothetical protein
MTIHCPPRSDMAGTRLTDYPSKTALAHPMHIQRVRDTDLLGGALTTPDCPEKKSEPYDFFSI